MLANTQVILAFLAADLPENVSLYNIDGRYIFPEVGDKGLTGKYAIFMVLNNKPNYWCLIVESNISIAELKEKLSLCAAELQSLDDKGN